MANYNNRQMNFKDGNTATDKILELPSEQLSEEDIGITQYISDHVGFHGIVKYRFSDFQVSEINLNGDVAKLTDTKAPPHPKPKEIVEDEDLLLTKYNLEILPKETWDRINQMIVDKDFKDTIQIDVTNATKEERTKIHNAVNNAFGSAVVGSTVPVGDKKYVQFKRYKRGDRIDKRVKWPWPAEYVYFIVHKTNCDSMEVATRLADCMRSHIKPQMITFAGNKDRRAITSQWFCLRKVEPSKILSASSVIRSIHVGNFSFHNEVLKLGMLKGNLFRLAIRNVTAPEEAITEACISLKEKGFLNYYGQQRFGSRKRVPTYLIGLHLLKGDFKSAIEYVLKAQEGQGGSGGGGRGAGRGARGRGGVGRGGPCPGRGGPGPGRGLEGPLLAALAAAPNDYCGAFNAIPRNMRLLYLNAYQSWVWNRCVSERVRRAGLAPRPGDLVAAPHIHLAEECLELDAEDNEEGSTKDANKNQDKSQQKQESKKIEVSHVTEEDVAAGRYTIFDIIMPLPGYKVEYPKNMIDYYQSLLEKDGLTLKLNKNKNQNYTLSGTYRYMVRLPSDVTWRTALYSDPQGDLVASDYDDLRGHEPKGIDAEGKYRALLLTFSLPSSSYATMLLRELLKADTSSHAQALHNKYYTHTDDNHHKRPTDSIDDNVKKVKTD